MGLPSPQLAALQALPAPADIDMLAGAGEDRQRYLASIGLAHQSDAATAIARG